MANRFEQRKKLEKQSRQRETYFDYTLLFVVLFLLAFGMIMIYSTSSYESKIEFGDAAYYLKRQFDAVLIGVCVMIGVAMIPYKRYKPFAQRGAILIYISTCGLILLVLTPLGMEKYGARRWLNIAGTSLQPAEVAKLAMILVMASFICKLGKGIRSSKGLWMALVVPVPISFMIFTITDNLSTAIIIMGMGVLMVFVSTPDYKRFLLTGLAGVSVIGVAVLCIINFASAESGFRYARVLAWINPEQYASSTGFQTLQSLYAIGSGGIFGKGLGQSMQKLGFLPEAQNDMIFSIICEELGLCGAIAVILLFLVLIWRCMIIANNAPDLFAALIVVGVMAHFAIQVILNIAVVTNTIPNTGITLPFISYGGSSVLFTLVEIGLVLGISRTIRFKN
ncbi:MAG: putative peptidoglycan glycosyltransferase FtsW [Eubacteriales bacterium]